MFSVLMALSILGLLAIQVAKGELADPSIPFAFGAIAAIAAALAARGLIGTKIPARPLVAA